MPKLKEELAFNAADRAWKKAKKEGKLSEDALYALEKKRFELHHKWEMAVSEKKGGRRRTRRRHRTRSTRSTRALTARRR